VERVTLEIGFDYADESAVRGVLHAAGLTEDDAQFGASVTWTVTLIEADVAGVQRRLVEQTAGRATVRVVSSGR
jgi:putative IMPACT (imprinted ancient) family translation regulator